MHAKFECDECDKVFRYEQILEKHKEAEHEDVQLFCHYYNNEKECPFEDDCIFAHEDSEKVKFGGNCERNMCMFKHEDLVTETCDSDDDSEDGDDNMIGDVGNNFDEIKPVLEQFEQDVDNFEQLLEKYSPKCKECEFEARDFNGLTVHVKAKHKK